MRRALFPLLVLLFTPLAAAGTPQLSLTTGSGQACVTESGSYALTVSNPGPASDTYELNVDSPWQDAATLTSSTVEVGADASEKIFFWIQVPKTASRGDHSFTVTAKSSNTGKTTREEGNINVLSCRSVSVDAAVTHRNVCRGEEATYRFTVTNDGQVEETYTIRSSTGTLSTGRVTLDAGEQTTVKLTASSVEEANRSIQVTAESTSSYATDTATVSFVSERCRDVALDIEPETTTVCSGDDVNVTATVRNNGTVRDDYRVQLGGETVNVSLSPGQAETLRRTVTVRGDGATFEAAATSRSLDRVSATGQSTLTAEQCYGIDLQPLRTQRADPGPTNRTLVEMNVANNGTKENTYEFLLDGPDWMDVRPASSTLSTGETTPVYVYAAPDFFGDGTYTATLVASGTGVQRELQMDVTARNGTVTVDLPNVQTPTGRITGRTSGLVSLIVTALILLVGGYWFFRREGVQAALSPTKSGGNHTSAGDYLDKNANRVVKALQDDALSDQFLNVLLEEEKQGKNRKRVLNQIRRELGDF
ncbi:MAG: hypothetical protein SVW02_01705 [Candidatus Nanohaloarchaea archaeon]|nr:hypothetical protein [Candidatus Nanohaloarchaea archaeon]